MSTYHEPLALIIISSISIGVAALVAIWIAGDIILRRGWKSMMAIMIPVYIINALYLWPITLWTYLQYGRPPAPVKKSQTDDDQAAIEAKGEGTSDSGDGSHEHHKGENDGTTNTTVDEEKSPRHDHGHDHEQHQNHEDHHHHHDSSSRPMFATVTISVCHCGAACVLGDIIGEWLVYGTGATLGNPPRALYPEFLIDFAFAFVFGIVFQYFSIAPMENRYGPGIILRALKADALSLLFFEIGLFGWMAIFQIAIFKWELPVDTVTYWWMMQIGMFLGHWTGVPINWWLVKTGVKMPCA